MFAASPLYLFNPLVPKRIFETIPQVKLIVLLRNPTERALSHYLHEARRHRDPLPCYEALQAEEERLKPDLATQNYKSRTFIYFSYKSRGLYRQQLERYWQYFPCEQILVLNSSDLFRNTDPTLKKVFEFVGVDASVRIKNKTPCYTAPNKREFEPHIYEYLHRYFKPHNQALYELIGKNYGWDENS